MNDYLVTVTVPDSGFRGVYFVPCATNVAEAKIGAWRRSMTGRYRFNPGALMLLTLYDVQEVK